MDEQIHHPRAPITEALLDIQVELAEAVSLETLASVGAALEEQYPTRRDQIQFEGEFSLDPEVSASSKHTQRGYIYLDKDELHSFQSRFDGFAFSRLKPYTNWEHFSAQARRLWEVYKGIVPVATITRIALRYINRLDLPLINGFVDFNDYLRTVPEISRDLPQGLSGYFMQLQIPLEDVRSMVNINEALVAPPNPDVASILLDIDLFRTIDIPQDEEGLWDTFAQLRLKKNRVFEASITENTRRLID